MQYKSFKHALTLCSLIMLTLAANGQMRRMYLDETTDFNHVLKISFYSGSEGFVAFTSWVGYTTDSGRTFTKKFITNGNVNFNGYSVNLTGGFGINGVQAFAQNNILVYGEYGLVPAILHSTDGGNNFKLIYHSQYNPLELSTGVVDMVFPGNGSTGYAIDADRVLKSTNQGLSWTMVRAEPHSFFERVVAPDINNVFVLSPFTEANKLIKTSNGGTNWQTVTLPVIPHPWLTGTFFLTGSIGWITMSNGDNDDAYVFKTINGGTNWTQQNDLVATPFSGDAMYFIDENTGYSLVSDRVYRTKNSGASWEAYAKDNNLTYQHYTLQVRSANQLWAGGQHGLLEQNTNAGGATIPKAYFKIDTTGVSNTGTVQLLNYSQAGHTYRWLLNKTQISTAYNASYTHVASKLKDTIQLIVTSGGISDTATRYQEFHPPVIVSSFTPTSAATGVEVTITGSNFTGTNQVSFGGVPALSFIVSSPTSIKAKVGPGASGRVKVVTATGRDSLAGFVYIPNLAVTSFTPTSAIAGSTVSISGANFINITNVSFGGVAATSFNVVSPTLITAVVPSGGSGSVLVTGAGGSSSLAGYIALPTINSFTPQTGTTGTVMTIKGTSFTGVTSVTIGGVNAASFTIGSADSISAVVGTGASGNVVVTKSGGSSTVGGFMFVTAPVITSFSPASGPVGANITITGSGFNINPQSNIVFFGAVKANVTNASATSLTVTVPVGASFEPISVTNNNLIGYSSSPFVLTFAGGGSISAASFANPDSIMSNDERFVNLKLADIDGDGKVDLIATHLSYPVPGIFLYRNTSSINSVSFSMPVPLSCNPQGAFKLGDLDGDGRLDIAITTPISISTFRNTSVPGTISYSQVVDFPTSGGAGDLAIGDVDGDGKADILNSQGNVCLFKNISEPGAILFTSPIVLNVAGGAVLLLADLDGDRKPEIVVQADESFYVSKNNCSIGIISFESGKLFKGYRDAKIAAADMDADGKTDLIFGEYSSSQLAIQRNTGSLNNFSFEEVVQTPANYWPNELFVADFDGDGKPDIANSLSYPKILSVYKNLSTPGNVKISPQLGYTGCYWCDGGMPGTAGDVNGDGKPDLLVISQNQDAILIHLNKVKPEPYITSFSPTIAGTGTSISISGVNFTGVSGVSFGGQPAASFIVNSATSITAVVGNGAAGSVSVTNSFGSGSQPGFAFGLPPVIASISPLSGPVGSSITITGSHFSPVAANNIVYFGNVKATVTAATATALTVTVPAGPSHQPFSVTVNLLTGYSSQFFIPTFPGAAPSFNSSSFADFTSNAPGRRGGVCDIDADGKPDIVALNGWQNISISRNTSGGGFINFAAPVDIATPEDATRLIFGDLDGDGKQDILALNYNSVNVTVWKNSSVGSNISMTLVGSFSTGVYDEPSWFELSDLDGDGKPDLIVCSYSPRTVSVLKNRSTVGTILFDDKIDFACYSYANCVAARDLDGDNKPDLIVSASAANTFRNLSVPGTIAFKSGNAFPSGDWPTGIATGDLDGDGKAEILLANINGNSVSVFPNTSNPGSILMAPRLDLATGSGPVSLFVSDLDGDGKPDLIARHGAISIFKNASVPGNLNFQHNHDLFVAGDMDVADMDGDGKPDIVIFRENENILILRNQSGVPLVNKSICANGSTSIVSSVSGTSYQWQQDSGGGFVNIANDSHVSGVTTATLQLTNIPSDWYGYKFRCVTNQQSSQTTVLVISNSWTGSANNFWNNPANWSCGSVPDGNTDVVINSGTIVLNINGNCRSLTLKPGVNFSVAAGYNLTVTH